MLRGNAMATKNQIAHIFWIMERYRIICVKLYKQNCLGKKQKTASGNEKNMILLQKIA